MQPFGVSASTISLPTGTVQGGFRLERRDAALKNKSTHRDLGSADAGQGGPTALDFRLGTLSIHFEAGRCRVACPFCYLGQRTGAHEGLVAAQFDADLAQAIETLPYRELAMTLSEPIEPLLEGPSGLGSPGKDAPQSLFGRLLSIAQARGRTTAVTTTLAVAAQLTPDRLPAPSRFNLSIDPWKGPAQRPQQGPSSPLDLPEIARVVALVKQRFASECVLILSLSTLRFVEELCDGLLASLLALPTVDRIALNALKPPPSWCDSKLWLRLLAAIRPLLAKELDRRLFLDCYVAARILGLGPCPGRPDLSPAFGAPPDTALIPLGRARPDSLAFRACIYQPAPDFHVASSADLAQRLASYVVPATCPFPIH